jgi:hypothetical protein
MSCFKRLVNVTDSTIHSLIVARKYLGDENWWKGIQQEYNLSTRPIAFDREFDYCDQLVTLSFFHLILSSFESSIRLIVNFTKGLGSSLQGIIEKTKNA